MATSNKSLPGNPSAYVSVAGPGSTNAILTVSGPSQYVFSATQPSASMVGHHINFDQSVSLDSMGDGIYMWLKSEYANGTAIITLTSDAVFVITKNQ